MPADEELGRLAHEAQVQPARNMPRDVAPQRIHGGMVPDEVTVLLAAGVKPGMKVGLGASGGQNPDVGGQAGVDGQCQLSSSHAGFGRRHLKMRHHAQRVNAGIGATGTMESRRGGEQLG